MCQLAKSRVDHPPHGITLYRELIAVAVAQIDRDPVVCDRHVDPTLELAVANGAKVIALKRAARRYTVAHKNSEDLASDYIVGGSVRHEEPAIERYRLVWLYQFALAIWRPSSLLRSYPRCPVVVCPQLAQADMADNATHDSLLMSAFAVAIGGKADMAFCAAYVCF